MQRYAITNFMSRTHISSRTLSPIVITRDWRSARLEICGDMRTRLLCHELNISSRTLSPIVITQNWRSAGLPGDIRRYAIRTLCHELNVSSRTLSSIIPHAIGVPLDYVYIHSVRTYVYVYSNIYRYILYVCVYIHTHIDT